jgi:hypothetical protein
MAIINEVILYCNQSARVELNVTVLLLIMCHPKKGCRFKEEKDQ